MDKIISKIWEIKSDLKFVKSIKSDYNLKEIFLFLGRKRLFNLIIYNKHLQKALKINIEDYKKISGYYKIGEKDGRGKVYILDTNILVFGGEYLNGKRNGKGKEYDEDEYANYKLKFEGEYLNGERNGKGKEYDKYCYLVFEGEYLNGKRNGKGKEYDEDESANYKLKFEGEYLNGERNGKGKEFYENGKLKFEGEYLNGKKWNGRAYDINGNI